jgi:hypothetical protein
VNRTSNRLLFVVDASVGRVVMEFSNEGRMRVTLLDRDGWTLKEGESGEAQLAAGLTSVAGIPDDQAQRIARTAHSQRQSL